MRRDKIWVLQVSIAILAVLGGAFVSAAPAAAAQASVKAINFPLDKQIEVQMKGTALAPEASGQANVEPKKGLMEIEGNLYNLKAPSTFGPEFLVYVLWAVSPEAKAYNLGPIRLASHADGKSEIRATTRLPAFAIGITAEPYYSVSKPSDTLVMVMEVPDKKYIQTTPIDIKTELLERARYKEAGIKPITIDPAVPLELYQARNAMAIAKWEKADQYAKDSLDKSAKALAKAEAAQKAPKPDTKAVVQAARESIQASDDAINVAAKREEEARLAAERKAAADREAAARAQAAKSGAERDAAVSENARIMAEIERRRSELLAKLNAILATEDTDRGLVATMADVNFETDKADLKPSARETLTKFAGVVALLPKLEFAIEGHTDSTGTDAHNMTLSEARAKTVRDFLVSHGISEAQVQSKGLGKALPVASNDSEEGRAKNRRVELIVSGEAIGRKIGG